MQERLGVQKLRFCCTVDPANRVVDGKLPVSIAFPYLDCNMTSLSLCGYVASQRDKHHATKRVANVPTNKFLIESVLGSRILVWIDLQP